MRNFLRRHGEGIIYGMALLGWIQLAGAFVKWLNTVL